jgi:hypothetical protein
MTLDQQLQLVGTSTIIHTHTDGFYLDLWNGEPHPRLISQPSQVMVHVLKDHVNAPFVLVAIDFSATHSNRSNE